MTTENQKSSAQQSNKSLTLTVFWKDEDESISFFRYNGVESVPVNVVLRPEAEEVLSDLRFVSKRSHGDNGDVVNIYSTFQEFKELANGDFIVSNVHYSRFQPKGLVQ